MSRTTLLLTIVALAAAGIGCSTADYGATTAPPAGPVRAATSETNAIPSGTSLVIRTNDAIETASGGQTYSAEVAESVENQSGSILVPRGSPAELVVMQASSGGTAGTAELELALRSITINGKKYTVSSDTSTRRGEEGIGQNRRTAEMVGGGALLGTLIGAVAGGGRGAVAGGLAGAAGGAAVQVLTRGREIKIPAETLLTFRLEDTLRLTA